MQMCAKICGRNIPNTPGPKIPPKRTRPYAPSPTSAELSARMPRTMMRPVCINTFKGMGPEVIALCLDQIRGSAFLADHVKPTQSRCQCRHRQPFERSGRDHPAQPCDMGGQQRDEMVGQHQMPRRARTAECCGNVV